MRPGPRAESDTWQAMIEGYLLGRPTLRMVFVLVDAEVGPTKLDQQMLDWLHHVRMPHRIVATKADQVKPGRQVARRRDVAAALGLAPDDVAWVSSKKGRGSPSCATRWRPCWSCSSLEPAGLLRDRRIGPRHPVQRPGYSLLIATPSIVTSLPLERALTLSVPLLTSGKVVTAINRLLIVVGDTRLTFLRSVDPQYTPTLPLAGPVVATSAIRFACTPVRLSLAPAAVVFELVDW